MLPVLQMVRKTHWEVADEAVLDVARSHIRTETLRATHVDIGQKSVLGRSAVSGVRVCWAWSQNIRVGKGEWQGMGCDMSWRGRGVREGPPTPL